MSERMSMKFRNTTSIRNTIMDKINENQDIKRLIYYNTIAPLSNFSSDIEGTIIKQPDVDIDFIMEDKRIHSSFSKETLKETETHIFVRRLESKLDDQAIGRNTITIDIFVPVKFSELEDRSNDREGLICAKIINLLDGQNITSLGKLTVTGVKEMTLEHKEKEYNCLVMFIEVPTSNMRA